MEDVKISNLNELDFSIRQEICDIYADNVKNIRKTMAIAKKYYKDDIESGTLIYPNCGRKIDKITLHAIVHTYATRDSGYWDKSNLIPLCSAYCHEAEPIEQYKLKDGTIISFDKRDYGKSYRLWLKDPNYKG